MWRQGLQRSPSTDPLRGRKLTHVAAPSGLALRPHRDPLDRPSSGCREAVDALGHGACTKRSAAHRSAHGRSQRERCGCHVATHRNHAAAFKERASPIARDPPDSCAPRASAMRRDERRPGRAPVKPIAASNGGPDGGRVATYAWSLIRTWPASTAATTATPECEARCAYPSELDGGRPMTFGSSGWITIRPLAVPVSVMSWI